jgi:hypothetical protein
VGLVAKVRASFQKLPHRDVGQRHSLILFRLSLGQNSVT